MHIVVVIRTGGGGGAREPGPLKDVVAPWNIWFERVLLEIGWMDGAVLYVPANTVYGRRFLQVKRPNQQ